MLLDTLLAIICVISHCAEASVEEFENNIYFNFYENNEIVFRSNLRSANVTALCAIDAPWMIIVPGWTETCSSSWVAESIRKFHQYRGGCIACMDYFYYSNDPSIRGYVRLRAQFDSISDVLVAWLRHFTVDHAADHGHMFAMSFGSQLAINAGRTFGGHLATIDACDPAGPLFYPDAEYQSRGPASMAARNVQIIHTSCDEGTLVRDGHQDWLMGNCGINQASANISAFLMPFEFPENPKNPVYIPFSKENHGACTAFYLSAFEHRFTAVENMCCLRSRRDVWPVPAGFAMGYMQPNKERIQFGNLYALTSKHAPYNAPGYPKSGLWRN